MSMYITLKEFKNAPSAIDLSNIVPGGTQEQNDAEALNIVRRASAWVNQICKQRTLRATVNTETKEVSLNNQGLLRIHPDNTPIIGLQKVEFCMVPAASWSEVSLEYVQAFERYFTVYNLNTYAISPSLVEQLPAFSYSSPRRIRQLQKLPLNVRYTYVNGWPHTEILTACYGGAKTVDVEDVTGIGPGTELTIYDDDLTEVVVVESVSGKTLTLVDVLVNDHDENTQISSLPATVKQATILLAGYLIKERGALTIGMGQTGAVMNDKTRDIGDVALAKELLRPFYRGGVS